MMDMAELVRTIVQEVLERTEAARAKACVRVLAPRDEALAERVRTLVAPYYENGADLLFLGEEDHGRRPVRHILPVLSCSDMAALAVGRAASACMEEVLGLLLRGVQQLRFRLDVNGVAAQEGYTGDMLFGIDSLIARISRYFTLKTGDLLFTGTPAGVGPVAIGDHLEGYVEDRKVLDFNCK